MIIDISESFNLLLSVESVIGTNNIDIISLYTWEIFLEIKVAVLKIKFGYMQHQTSAEHIIQIGIKLAHDDTSAAPKAVLPFSWRTCTIRPFPHLYLLLSTAPESSSSIAMYQIYQKITTSETLAHLPPGTVYLFAGTQLEP